jgi:hydroxyacylglutathione hydrolase
MFDVSFIPAFKDNYIWLLTRGKRAFVVDPGDAAPVHGAAGSLQG